MEINSNMLNILQSIHDADYLLYPRELERKLQKDISLILRDLKKLRKANILDYKESGRNHLFFLKDTLEADNALIMMEAYKAQKFIEKNNSLSIIIKELSREADIAVFGSYADNTSHKKSDIDVVIFSKETKELRDIIARSIIEIHPQYAPYKEFVKLVEKKQTLALEILRNHVLFGKYKEFIELKKWAKSNGALIMAP